MVTDRCLTIWSAQTRTLVCGYHRFFCSFVRAIGSKVLTFNKTQLLVLFVVTLVVVSGLTFFLGARYGANTAVTALQSISFGARQSNLQRLLELDGILASGDTALARRKIIAVARAEYLSLEAAASDLVLLPTDAMRDSISVVRGTVTHYCQSDVAKTHGDLLLDVCAEMESRSNTPLEQTRER